MSRAASIAKDLRALGSSAPLRAAYEASKRSNFHSVLFRQLRGRGLRSQFVGLGTWLPESEVARKRCLEDAVAIVAEGTRVFGRRVTTGVHAPWNVDPVTGDAWPRDTKWWQIDIRTDDRLSDVKWVWEAGRHRDLVVLARAAALEPGGRWLTELEAMLRAWLAQCRPERGVNWYSSLELALRAIAWAQVLDLVGDRLNSDIRTGLDEQLVASARHIMLELPYTVSSMKNNHLLGDGLGLVVLAKMFPEHPGAKRWHRVGDALFHKQLERHMRPDGSMIEDSLSYHRFVMEMLVVRHVVAKPSAAVDIALSGAAGHLERLGVLAGQVPQFGDWDEGRVLADSSPAGSVAGSTLLALALSGKAVDAEAWELHDELAWYAAPTAASVAPQAVLEGSWRSGDFQYVSHGDWRVWFKTGSGASHQHADVSSLWVERRGTWIVRDPGTGTYNGPLDVRNGFRTSPAHPVWRANGQGSLAPHRAFRWLGQVMAYAADPTKLGRATVLAGWHDAYAEDRTAGRTGRVVVITEAAVGVIDFAERTGATWQLTIPLGDGAHEDDLFGLAGPASHHGSREPFRGWHSDTYGEWHPSTWLEVSASELATMWGVGDRAALEGLDVEHRWDEDSLTVSVVLGAEHAQVVAHRG